MRTALLRFYYYVVTAFALLYLTVALQDFLHTLLLRAGLTDVITLDWLFDQIGALPVFTNIEVILAVLVIGVIHWLLVRNDRKTAGDGGGLIRAWFLSVLSATFGIIVLIELLLDVRNVSDFSLSGLLVPAPLAVAAAWAISLILILFEWSLGGRQFTEGGQKVALFVALLGQWVIVALAIWAIAQSIQSYLQTALNRLPQCSPSLDIFSLLVTFISRLLGLCTDVPAPISAMLTLVLVIIAWIGYAYWGAHYESTRTRLNENLDTIIGTMIAGAALIYAGVLGAHLFLGIFYRQPGVSLSQSLLSTPNSLDVSSYPFLGWFIAGFCVLAAYWLRSVRTYKLEAHQFFYVTLAFLLAPVFFFGTCRSLGDIFVAILHLIGFSETGITTDEWIFCLMFFIPGLLGGLLIWRFLRKIGRGEPGISALCRIVYVNSFLWGTRLTAIGCLVILGGLIFYTAVILPDSSALYYVPYLVATMLITGAFAFYYYKVKDNWDI